MENITLIKGDLFHAKLKNEAIIHGIIEKVYDTSFLIDDDVSSDIFIVENSEVEEVYHHL